MTSPPHAPNSSTLFLCRSQQSTVFSFLHLRILIGAEECWCGLFGPLLLSVLFALGSRPSFLHPGQAKHHHLHCPCCCILDSKTSFPSPVFRNNTALPLGCPISFSTTWRMLPLFSWAFPHQYPHAATRRTMGRSDYTKPNRSISSPSHRLSKTRTPSSCLRYAETLPRWLTLPSY